MDEVAGIAYQVHRSQGQAARRSLILIHGAGGNHLYWPPEIRHLPGFSVYAIDLPGHGRSRTNPRTSIEDYSQTLIGWLRALQLGQVILAGPVILAGHSMGSAIAMQAALDEPELISALALLGGSARLKINPLLLEGTEDPAAFADTVTTIIDWSFSQAAELSSNVWQPSACWQAIPAYCTTISWLVKILILPIAWVISAARR